MAEVEDAVSEDNPEFPEFALDFLALERVLRRAGGRLAEGI